MVARIHLSKDLAMKAESSHMTKMKTLHKDLVEGMEKAHDKGLLEASDKESQDLKSEVIEPERQWKSILDQKKREKER